MAELFDTAPTPAVERLARIEGQSNFISLLAGVEAGPDTTQDMGALSFCRLTGGLPEALEAHIAQSVLFKLPIMSALFEVVKSIAKPKESEYPWIQGAIADAFGLVRVGHCKPVKVRAKSFKVGHEAYSAMRGIAWSILGDFVNRTETAWRRSRFSGGNITTDRHSDRGEGEWNSTFRMGNGNFRATPLGYDDDGNPTGNDTRGIGIVDRTAWVRWNDRPGPVIECTPEQVRALNIERGHIELPAQPTAPALADQRSSHNRPASIPPAKAA